MGVKGTSAVLKSLAKFERDASQEVRNVINAAALSIQGDAIKLIQRGDKTGNAYTKGGKTHIASAPGEAPATDTGSLVASIKVKQASTDKAYVYAEAEYAPMLEFGTTRMDERPFMRPAVKMNEKKFTKLLQDAIKGLGR